MPRSIGWLESGGSEEVGGGEPEVITKGVGEMRAVGEPGVMGRSGERRALGERFDGVQHPDPPPVAAQRDADLSGEALREPAGGQAGAGGELDQGAGAGVIGELCEEGSNWHYETSLADFLTKQGIPCLYNVDMMEETTHVLAMGAGGISKRIFPEEGHIERAPNVSNIHDYLTRTDEMIQRKRDLFL